MTPVVGVIYLQNLVEFPEKRVECYPRIDHGRPEGGVELYLYSFFHLGVRWRCVVNITRRPFPAKETRYPLYRSLGETQDRSGRVLNIPPPTEISIVVHMAGGIS